MVRCPFASNEKLTVSHALICLGRGKTEQFGNVPFDLRRQESTRVLAWPQIRRKRPSTLILKILPPSASKVSKVLSQIPTDLTVSPLSTVTKALSLPRPHRHAIAFFFHLNQKRSLCGLPPYLNGPSDRERERESLPLSFLVRMMSEMAILVGGILCRAHVDRFLDDVQ